MGEIVHKLIQDKKIPAGAVAKAVSMSKSNVYKIYNRPTLDIDKLINLSHLLDLNLLDYYYREEPLKSINSSLVRELEAALEEKRKELAGAEAEIARLNREYSHQSKLLSLMEEKVNYLLRGKGQDKHEDDSTSI